MNKTVSMMVGVLVLALVGWGMWYWYPKENTSTPTKSDDLQSLDQTNVNQTGNTNSTDIGTIQIEYTNSGFSPKTVTIQKGQTVTWINKSSKNMWVASAAHPSHTVYSGTSLSEHCPDINNSSFDECKGDAPGTNWSFTFNKTGTWNYHDHLSSFNFGSVIVTQ